MTTTYTPTTAALASELRAGRTDANLAAALERAQRDNAALRDEVGMLRLAAAQMLQDLTPRHGSIGAASAYYFPPRDLPADEETAVRRRQRALTAAGKDPWQCQAVDCLAFFPVQDMAWRHERQEHPYITYPDPQED